MNELWYNNSVFGAPSERLVIFNVGETALRVMPFWRSRMCFPTGIPVASDETMRGRLLY